MYSEEYKERLQLFKDAISFKKPKRTPFLSDFFTWKICDSPYTFKEALYNYDIMEKVVCQFHERYGLDAYTDLGTRNQMLVIEAMGKGSSYYFDEEKDSINVVDNVLMEGDEYADYVKDPARFMKMMFARKYPQATAKNITATIEQLMKFMQFSNKMSDIFENKYSIPRVMDTSTAVFLPAEIFSSALRGIKGFSIDMRRNPDGILAASDAYFKINCVAKIEAQVQADTSMNVFEGGLALLAYSTMTPKQFDRFYWPYLKKYADALTGAGKPVFLYCESTMERFSDFFAEYPKGSLILSPELDDLFTIREKVPGACLVGGIHTDVLGHGSPQDTVDLPKKMIDGLGEGYILSTYKMVSFKNDCKRENLLALSKFVKEYTL